jgi:D-alanyl-D-alanine dipeptidase
MNSKFIEYGLIDIQSIDSSIRIDLKYATSDNFMGTPLYPKIGAYCVPELAHAIAAAQKTLKSIEPSYSLTILDAARPISIQKAMFDKVKGTASEKYIANPYGKFQGGFHNYGMAVDLTISDHFGNFLDLGTKFDEFSDKAHVGNEYELFRTGSISRDALVNRMLLYYIMGKNNLFPYPYEWWHYQIHQEEENKQNFKLLDF